MQGIKSLEYLKKKNLFQGNDFSKMQKGIHCLISLSF